jgi:hypothetical protein
MPLVTALAAGSGRGLGQFGLTIAQILSIVDNFNRSNSSSLGFTSDGKAEWQVLQGSFSINSNTARSSSTTSIAVVDIGASNVKVSSSLSWAGDALYFRVVNSSNWFRILRYFDQVDNSYTQYYNTYPWVSTRDGYNHPGDGIFCQPAYHGPPSPVKEQYFPSSGPPGTFCYSPLNHTHDLYFPACYNGNTGGYFPPDTLLGLTINHTHNANCTSDGVPLPQSIYVPQIDNYYYIALQRSVNGSISTLRDNVFSSAYTVTSVQVTVNGNTINTKYNGGSTNLWNDISDSNHSSATLHGIGRGPAGDSTSNSIDDFSVTRL